MSSDPETRMYELVEVILGCKTWGELWEVCFENGLSRPRPAGGPASWAHARKPGGAGDFDVHRSADFRCARAEVGAVCLLGAWGLLEPGGYEDWETRKRLRYADALQRLEESGRGFGASERLGVSWEDPGNEVFGRWRKKYRASYATGRLEGFEACCAAVQVRREATSRESWAPQLSESLRCAFVSGKQEP